MIASLTGAVSGTEGNQVVLDVGGVGYLVTVPAPTLSAIGGIGARASLKIHTYVREDEIALFGFSSSDELKLFRLLIGVTGIGPKVAISVLSVLDVAAVCAAINSDDARVLTRVPGIGLKTAQRAVLELKEKIARLILERRVESKGIAAPPVTEREDVVADVAEALVNLGYSRNDSKKASERAVKEGGEGTSTPDALRAALNLLTGGR
jgi:Holliday junction DNA helicase RuvA